ncbi:MAG TPA: TM2 domain-containing protein [Gemmataceae bacterium]|nr:TM2 domain-containing protein [Gemmataceae bacterium]
MIHYSCPMCSAKLEAKESVAGEKHACPNCGQRLQIPAPWVNKTVLGKLENVSEISNDPKKDSEEARATELLPEVSPVTEEGGSSSRIVTGVTAIIFGWFGLHHFLLGRVSLGIVGIFPPLLGLFSLFTVIHCCTPFFLVPWVFAIIDGVHYLSMTNKEFAATVLCPNPEEGRRVRLRWFITAGTAVAYILSFVLVILGFLLLAAAGA